MHTLEFDVREINRYPPISLFKFIYFFNLGNACIFVRISGRIQPLLEQHFQLKFRLHPRQCYAAVGTNSLPGDVARKVDGQSRSQARPRGKIDGVEEHFSKGSCLQILTRIRGTRWRNWKISRWGREYENTGTRVIAQRHRGTRDTRGVSHRNITLRSLLLYV